MSDEQNKGDGDKVLDDPATDSYQIPGWHAGLPDAYKGHAALKGMDVPGKLVEAYLSSMDKASQNEGRTYFPGEGASSEEWSNYRKAIGVPETKDGYEFHIPDDVDRNEAEAIANWVKEVSFEQGFSGKAAQNVFDRWINDTKTSRASIHEKQVQATAEREAGLKEKYGEKWEPMKAGAGEFIKKNLGENVYNSMTEKQLLDNPEYLEAFSNLSGRLGEDTLPDSAGTPASKGVEGLDALFPTMK